MITEARLKAVYKEAPIERIRKFLDPLNRTLEEFELTPLPRLRSFLAQIGHESGQLRYVEEIASGSAYEGRRDLGNTSPGDGVKYKGRGLIQLTGKRNYALCGLALDLPLLEKPELLQLPENACRSAGWFVKNNNLYALMDGGLFKELTRRINGGLNGLADREMLHARAQKVWPDK